MEKGAFTKRPRWKVAGRQSSSVSVLLPTVALTGYGAAGIDSVAEFRFDAVQVITIRNTSLGPPQKGGLGDDDFNFKTIRRRRSVSTRMQ